MQSQDFSESLLDDILEHKDFIASGRVVDFSAVLLSIRRRAAIEGKFQKLPLKKNPPLRSIISNAIILLLLSLRSYII